MANFKKLAKVVETSLEINVSRPAQLCERNRLPFVTQLPRLSLALLRTNKNHELLKLGFISLKEKIYTELIENVTHRIEPGPQRVA